MLLSRVWLFCLALTTGLALAAAGLVEGTFKHEQDRFLNEALRRDRIELEAGLQLDARSRLDAILAVASNVEIRTLMLQLQTPPVVTRTLGEKVEAKQLSQRQALQAWVRDLTQAFPAIDESLFFVLDAGGNIITQVGTVPDPNPDVFSKLPSVQRALQGFLADDALVYRKTTYQIAVYPILENNRALGAIVYAKRFGSELASRMSAAMGGVTVAFFSNNEIVASHVPAQPTNAPTQAQIGSALPGALKSFEASKSNLEARIDLAGSGRTIIKPLSWMAGSPVIGFAVARPRQQSPSAFEILSQATSEDVSQLPFGALLTVVLVLALIGIILTFVERDLPLRRFRSALRSLKPDSTPDRLQLSSFSGVHRRLAEQVNTALDKVQASASEPKGSVNLGVSTRAEPSILDTPPLFSVDRVNDNPRPAFAATERVQTNKDELSPQLQPSPSRTSSIGDSANAKRISIPPMTQKEPHAEDDTSPTLELEEASTPGTSQPKPVIESVRPPAIKPAVSRNTVVERPAIKSMQLPPPVSSVAVSPMPKPPLTTPLASPPLPPIPTNAAAKASQPKDESHVVYEEFLRTKIECGESTTGLTYERFLVALQKNREQIMRSHGAVDVHFSVYIKDGKATLKATPKKNSLSPNPQHP